MQNLSFGPWGREKEERNVIGDSCKEATQLFNVKGRKKCLWMTREIKKEKYTHITFSKIKKQHAFNNKTYNKKIYKYNNNESKYYIAGFYLFIYF